MSSPRRGTYCLLDVNKLVQWNRVRGPVRSRYNIPVDDQVAIVVDTRKEAEAIARVYARQNPFTKVTVIRLGNTFETAMTARKLTTKEQGR